MHVIMTEILGVSLNSSKEYVTLNMLTEAIKFPFHMFPIRIPVWLGRRAVQCSTQVSTFGGNMSLVPKPWYVSTKPHGVAFQKTQELGEAYPANSLVMAIISFTPIQSSRQYQSVN